MAIQLWPRSVDLKSLLAPVNRVVGSWGDTMIGVVQFHRSVSSLETGCG